ncbi:MAG: glycosyltransferase, partial [Pseudomonadota bacterium]
MRCLWLTRILPQRMDAGDLIYSGKLMRAVARNGVEVVCVGFGHPSVDCDRKNGDSITWLPISGQPKSRLRALFSKYPLETARRATDGYRKTVRELLDQGGWDLVVIDHFGMGWITDVLGASQTGGTTVVYISHNFESTVSNDIADSFQRSWIEKRVLRFNAVKTANLEQRLTSRCDRLAAITEEDASRYQDLSPPRAPIV